MNTREMSNQIRRQVGPVEDGKAQAQAESVGVWFLVGILGIIGLLIVYLRSPAAPVDAVAKYTDPDARQMFERAYVQVLKERQVKLTWAGFATIMVIVIIGTCASALVA